MRLEHDRRHDVAYFAFTALGATRQVRLDDARVIDYGDDGSVVGVEFVSPSRGIDLGGVPRAAEIEREARRHGLTIRVPASTA